VHRYEPQCPRLDRYATPCLLSQLVLSQHDMHLPHCLLPVPAPLFVQTILAPTLLTAGPPPYVCCPRFLLRVNVFKGAANMLPSLIRHCVGAL
jgi:hypothetical protein